MSSNTKSAALRPGAAVLTVGVWIAVTLAISGCGGGSGSTSTQTSTPAAPATSSTPTSTPTTTTPPASSSSSSGLSGKWSGQYSGAYSGTFKLDWNQNGSKLSGTIDLSTGGTLPVHGTVTGSSIKFGTVGGQAITYTGTVSGSSMSGTYSTPGGGGPWSAHETS
ncbi:MAG: hypothetical protein ACXVRH_10280 [Thermoleophilaceae bacterium]